MYLSATTSTCMHVFYKVKCLVCPFGQRIFLFYVRRGTMRGVPNGTTNPLVFAHLSLSRLEESRLRQSCFDGFVILRGQNKTFASKITTLPNEDQQQQPKN